MVGGSSDPANMASNTSLISWFLGGMPGTCSGGTGSWWSAMRCQRSTASSKKSGLGKTQ